LRLTLADELEALRGGEPVDAETVERVREAALRSTTDDQMLGELCRRGRLLLEQPDPEPAEAP
jgi:hypothetical protein